ncbi:MAG: hypothetical protein IT537_17770 [Hyphomicrobiales bacterium]|nr:hypothetical protein [Hyphomicrobiales bacterium]
MRRGSVRLAGLMLWLVADPGFAQDTVYHATLKEPGQKSAEASTEDVRRALADGSALVLDSRKRAEYVAGHIAGARNAAPSPGAPPAEFVTTVERLASGDKARR